MVKNKTLLKLGAVLAMLSTEGHAIGSEATTLVKPEIQRIVLYKGKWTLVYTDVQGGSELTSEKVIVDNTFDREVNVGAHQTRAFSLTGGYSEESCHKAHIEVYTNTGMLATKSDVFNFGDTTNCIETMGKPVIKKISYDEGKWQILYKDVRVTANIDKEVLFIDGEMDRVVNAGTNDPGDRGFYLDKTNYSQTECHTAFIVTYDKDHNIVSTSDVFNFGDTTMCNNLELDPDVIAPVVTLKGVTPQVIKVGETYEELGATANDTRDGDITNNILVDSSAVDTSAIGNYRVYYAATDAAGNHTSVVRMVEVVSPSNVEKPEIHLIKFYDGKWHIRYKDVQISRTLSTEELVIDGAIDRVVPAGINSYDDRGFSLIGSYDEATCHEAYIIIKDVDAVEVKRSAVFKFGNAAACTLAQ
jgi:hypothetical protein